MEQEILGEENGQQSQMPLKGQEIQVLLSNNS
jgi:hypothetical protein